ncbi:SRPBCC family protein [Snuella sedimenti]|uniref:SRPBCC family protein n=1 Tax=Snuella sedimenti TaxID=2798802 RepID=A0A8J7J2V4_9FLAO|nr:SRPBCC family protein [Snuella sedimenti]MBJ6367283.1 SRPBCC family protein [Snuella sedimenti]
MKKYCVVMLVLVAMVNLGYSQMTPAKQIPPNVTQQIKIKAPVQVVYDYLRTFDNVNEYASDLVLTSKIVLRANNPQREVVFKNGNKRLEELAIIAPKANKLGVKVMNPDNRFSRYFYYFEIRPKGAHISKVTLKAYYGLNDNTLSKAVKKEVQNEFKIILEGLKNHFEN